MIIKPYSRKLRMECQKELARHNMSEIDITHVCIAPNLFPLLQYILLMDDDVAFHHTFYFVSEIIPHTVQQKLPCKQFMIFKSSIKNEIEKRINKLTLRLYRCKTYPFLKDASLLAYDLPYSSLCIGNRHYGLLADSPNWLSIIMKKDSPTYQSIHKRKKSIIGQIQRFVYGDLFVNYFGNNDQCKDVYLTEENFSPILEGKNVHVNSIESLWEKASCRKQDFIRGLFGITTEDITILNSRPIIFFSQPLREDCSMSTDEFLSLMRPLMNKYGERNVIIKTHPRDKFDYTSHFPELVVFDKVISSQLLYLMGVRPKKISTIFSTAIEGFPETLECDFYGTETHPKLIARYGEIIPKRKVNHCHLANS